MTGDVVFEMRAIGREEEEEGEGEGEEEGEEDKKADTRCGVKKSSKSVSVPHRSSVCLFASLTADRGDFTGDFPIIFTGDFPINFAGEFTSVTTIVFEGDFVIIFPGDFTGDFLLFVPTKRAVG